MDTRQDLLEIRRIFNKMFEEVVWNFLNKYPYLGDPEIGSLDREISFFISSGDMYFCKGKYHLIGDGKGSNPLLDQLYERNIKHKSPTFAIKVPSHHNGIYLLHLDRTDTLSEDNSRFIKHLNIEESNPQIFNREEMFRSEDFKKCILQMVKDIAPDWLYKFEAILA